MADLDKLAKGLTGEVTRVQAYVLGLLQGSLLGCAFGIVFAAWRIWP